MSESQVPGERGAGPSEGTLPATAEAPQPAQGFSAQRVSTWVAFGDERPDADALALMPLWAAQKEKGLPRG